jgi:hypothetical protein
VITGVGQGAIGFSSSDGLLHDVPGPEEWHMFLVQYDVHGNFQWGEWNQASPNSIPRRVAVDRDGVYVTGWFEGAATFHSQDGQDQTVQGFSQPVQSSPDYPGDAFLVKYDSNGNLKWVNHIGGYKAIATDVAVSSDGEVSITGFIGNIDYGTSTQAETIVTSQPPGVKIDLGGGHFTRPYNADVVIASYDSAGSLKNALRFGSVYTDAGSGIAYDTDSNLYVTGVFKGTVNFGGQLLTGTQQSNLFVLKYTASGMGAVSKWSWDSGS